MSQLLQMTVCGAFVAMLCGTVIFDHRFNRIPNILTASILIIGILMNINANFVPLYESATGAVAGYTMIRLWHGFQISRRGFAGIGLGDAKLLAGLGAWFGASLFTLVIYRRRRKKPFGVGLGLTASAILAFHQFRGQLWNG